MGSIKKEVEFCENLLKEGKVQTLSNETMIEDNVKFAKMNESILPPTSLIIKQDLSEAPADEFPVDGPLDDPLPLDDPMDEPVPMDDPAPMDEPSEDDVVANPLTDAIKALFLTSIVRTGSNFKEYNSEAMKEALEKQGVDGSTYDAIGKAFYELDTKSEMFN